MQIGNAAVKTLIQMAQDISLVSKWVSHSLCSVHIGEEIKEQLMNSLPLTVPVLRHKTL